MTFLWVWVWIVILPQIKIWNKPEIKKKSIFPTTTKRTTSSPSNLIGTRIGDRSIVTKIMPEKNEEGDLRFLNYYTGKFMKKWRLVVARNIISAITKCV
jgi:hypothetical protein